MTPPHTTVSNNGEQNKVHSSDFHFDMPYVLDAGIGLNRDTVEYISTVKNEDPWLRAFRLRALETFLAMPMPEVLRLHGIDDLNFDKIRYYLANDTGSQHSWDDVSPEVKTTFDRLGIPEREQKFLAGIEAQFDSEAAYNRIQDALAKEGVIFVDSAVGLKKYPEIFRKYFASVVPIGDNKFSALNSAVFSGGSFIYVPRGVKVKQPLQAYFRINAQNFGQFERTLIVVDEDAEVTYMEGCTAPRFETATLHSAVVELIALKNSKIQYITVQNWSNNVYNLVTKRSIAHENAEIRWIDCNIGSKLTVKYPTILLAGEKARGEVLSIALAANQQIQDTGAKMIHLANGTSSNIISKSISKGNGLASYKGVVHVNENLKGCKNNTQCDALLIDNGSRSDTYPKITVHGNKNNIQHEASVSKIDEERLYYLQQRGISKGQATSLCVNGFVNELIQEFPLEYSVELKRLIDFEINPDRQA
ncbi:MAG: Fe-S cluster assembly protein SufB [Puniceicoccales bacterium]|jgi:Fe-S cluster assembly protein SufB|nr:Fe-S cluster assembly protein SufB [Puniceicoccales bacterium]